MKRWAFNVLLAVDVLASSILGGMPGETLSGRAGAAYQQGTLRGRIFAPIIDFIMRDPMHCQNAIAGDLRRAQAVVADDTRQSP